MSHPYETLLPDTVIDAVESLGLISDQRIFPLNSYENRVYRVGIEGGPACIAKFYRPERWTKEAIQEEHDFTFELLDNDIQVVAPQRIDGQSLHEFKGFQFALFPMQGGYAPELDNPDTLYRIGLNIGRLHQVGAAKTFKHRNNFSIDRLAIESRDFLLSSEFIPDSLKLAYESLSSDLIKQVSELWGQPEPDFIRLHGDCHLGNILWRDDKAFFVDLDDCAMGPAIQDIWLLLNGDRSERIAMLSEFLEGYEEFYDFDPRQLRLIEPLRTLRIMHYAAWLARRWEDPAFPLHFTWFNTERYWSEHILELREQFALLQEEPLKLMP